jgi:hypothetical protein
LQENRWNRRVSFKENEPDSERQILHVFVSNVESRPEKKDTNVKEDLGGGNLYGVGGKRRGGKCDGCISIHKNNEIH